MQIQYQFPCSAVQFFNFMARRIAQDIQIETDKKLTISQIHQGMKYEKKIKVSQQKQRIGKTQLTVFEKPSHVQLQVEMFDGTQILDTVCQPVDENCCRVTYSEEFLPARLDKKLMLKGFGWTANKKNRTKLERMMQKWEEEIVQLYGKKVSV